MSHISPHNRYIMCVSESFLTIYRVIMHNLQNVAAVSKFGSIIICYYAILSTRFNRPLVVRNVGKLWIPNDDNITLELREMMLQK